MDTLSSLCCTDDHNFILIGNTCAFPLPFCNYRIINCNGNTLLPARNFLVQQILNSDVLPFNCF